MKAVLQLVAVVGSLLVAIVLGLRGIVVLGSDADDERTRAHAFLQTVNAELDRWHADSGHYPDDINVLRAASDERDLIGVTELFGGVMRAPLNGLPDAVGAVRAGRLLDPWGRPWEYEVDEDSRRVRVRSLGSDRAPGGVGTAADLELTRNGRASTFVHLGEDRLW